MCGAPAHVSTGRRPRKSDGLTPRRYVCITHKEHDQTSPERCDAAPFDAIEVDRIVVAGIDSLLGDAETLRQQLNAGRVAEVERLGLIAAQAREEAAKAERVVEKAQARYERALADDDDEAAEIAMAAVKRQRDEAERARVRLNAALDALSGDPHADDGDVLTRIWAALNARVTDARGDLAKLNATLRQFFAAFELHRDSDGQLAVVPVLNAAAVASLMRDPSAYPSHEISIEMDGCQGVITGDGDDRTLTFTGPDDAVAALEARFQAGEEGFAAGVDVVAPVLAGNAKFTTARVK